MRVKLLSHVQEGKHHFRLEVGGIECFAAPSMSQLTLLLARRAAAWPLLAKALIKLLLPLRALPPPREQNLPSLRPAPSPPVPGPRDAEEAAT
jgi:hypothetical protein